MSGVKVGELFAELGIRDLTPQQLREAEREFERATMRMDRIADPALGVDTSGFDVDVATAVRRIERFGTTSGEARIDADGSGVSAAVGRAESELRSIDAPKVAIEADTDSIESAGEDVADAISSGWSVPVLGAVAGLGAAAGMGLVDAFLDWAARDKETDRLGAALGLTDADAERYGRIAGELYGQAYGDSFAEVTGALRSGDINALFDLSDTDTAIETTTARLLEMAEVFEQDIPALSKAAGQLIKTGLAKDTEEALDLITRAFQTGGDQSGDLLDTLIEYSVLFQALGIEGPAAIGMVNQVLGAGARDADKVADAMKEFTVRAKDGSDLTAEAFRALGLDAEATALAFAAGGPGAAAAFDVLLDKMRQIEDPLERNRVATALFGTQAEDLQKALEAMDPSTAVSTLGDITGAAQDLSRQANDNVATDLEALMRKTRMNVEDYLGSLWEAYDEGGFTGLLEKLDSDIGKLSDWWDDNGDELMDRFGAWWSQTGGPLMGEMASEGFQIAFSAAFDALKEWVTGEAPTRAIVDIILQQFADFLAGDVPDLVGGLMDAVADMTRGVANSVVDALNWVIDAWNSLDPSIGITIPDFVPGYGGKEWHSGDMVPDLPSIPGFSGGGGGSSFGGSFGGIGGAVGAIGDAIPRFRDGGQVLAPEGSPVLALVHGGEVVRNPQQEAARDRLLAAALEGGGSTRSGRPVAQTFVTHNHGLMDARELARHHQRQLLFGRG